MTRGRPTDRELQEMAIDVMRHSVAERRGDGKATPKVGAVLVRQHGAVQTACRGELRDGDHAEYTLLERKNRAERIDDGVLFATLEPCAPGARKHPKLGCAQRVVLARIRTVWIGIEDPDPTVARKGIQYLLDNDVEVRMFDADLQQIIQEENKEFLRQATERAAAAQQPPAPIELSPLERSMPATNWTQFSSEALGRFVKAESIAGGVPSDETKAVLTQLGLLGADGKPTGFGLLLFGEHPRQTMPQAGLLGTIHYSGGEEVRDFNGPLVLVPEQVETWLRDKLPHAIRRDSAQRTENADVPFEMIREGVANALIHRDYTIEGAKVQLIVTPDTIVIKSPGMPVPPLTLEQVRSLDAPMLSRNPHLHYVFSRLKLAEERGLGLRSLRDRAVQVGLPRPSYSSDGVYLTLTIYRNRAGRLSTLSSEVRESLSASELKGWEWLSVRERVKAADYAQALGVDDRTARRHLSRFVELGLAKQIGSARSTEYVVNQ